MIDLNNAMINILKNFYRQLDQYRRVNPNSLIPLYNLHSNFLKCDVLQSKLVKEFGVKKI